MDPCQSGLLVCRWLGEVWKLELINRGWNFGATWTWTSAYCTLFFPVPYSIIYWVYCSDVILIFASVDSLCWFYAWNSGVEKHVNTRNKGKTTLCSTRSSPICFLHSYIWKFLSSLKSHPVLRVFFLVQTGSIVKGPGFGLYLIFSSKQSKETHRTCRVRLLIDCLQIERKPIGVLADYTIFTYLCRNDGSFAVFMTSLVSDLCLDLAYLHICTGIYLHYYSITYYIYTCIYIYITAVSERRPNSNCFEIAV